MNTGFGFSEILLIVTVIVIFFGSKELPVFLREIAKFTAKVRRYSDRIKREIDDVTRSLEPQPVPFAEQREKKKELRAYYLAARKKLDDALRVEKSATITDHLCKFDKVKNATMIMLYINMGAEVITRTVITSLLKEGKRIIVPYCASGGNNLGIAEIKDLENDIIIGEHGVPEPNEGLRTSFFKSDLQVIVCPGVAFDRQGGRLGRGKGYYDSFLHEVRGKIPIIGLAYDCQVMEENMPFEYHDVSMDHVITESGIIVGVPESASTTESTEGAKLAG